MFDIEMLPAREGDCLWIRYGDAQAPHQILIDGGRLGTYRELKTRLQDLPADLREFELLVITHVDRDHIEGVLAMMEDPDLAVRFKEVWFNGYDHLQGTELETFGAVQGERLTTALLRRKERWNKSFHGGPVKIPDQGALPTVPLAGGLTLTILSPDSTKLANLLPQWEKECEEAGLQPGIEARLSEIDGLETLGGLPDVEKLAAKPLKADTTLPNGSSIALLAEYQGVRVLLGADAHIDRLIPSLQALIGDGERLPLDAFKLAHHGSSGNVSQQLLELVDCPRYLVSTNGSYFKHPTAEAIARVLKFGGANKTLFFNYDSDFTKVWLDDTLQADYGYQPEYPPGENGTLRVSLQA
jgi:beta-lactamase superfamily II metal-dependent hydrolase